MNKKIRTRRTGLVSLNVSNAFLSMVLVLFFFVYSKIKFKKYIKLFEYLKEVALMRPLKIVETLIFFN